MRITATYHCRNCGMDYDRNIEPPENRDIEVPMMAFVPNALFDWHLCSTTSLIGGEHMVTQGVAQLTKVEYIG